MDDRHVERLADVLDEVLAQPARARAAGASRSRSGRPRSGRARRARPRTAPCRRPAVASRPSPRRTRERAVEPRLRRVDRAGLVPGVADAVIGRHRGCDDEEGRGCARPRSAAARRATRRLRPSRSRPQARGSCATSGRIVQQMLQPLPGRVRTGYSTWPTANEATREHDAADQAPDLEREAVDALRHEHEHDARRRSRSR